jgi:hypothetical protein
MMVRIVGFLGCLYLLVKGFEFLASSGFRAEDGQLKLGAKIAAAVCFIGGFGFAVWLVVQSHHASSGRASFHSSEFPDPFKSETF